MYGLDFSLADSNLSDALALQVLDIPLNRRLPALSVGHQVDIGHRWTPALHRVETVTGVAKASCMFRRLHPAECGQPVAAVDRHRVAHWVRSQCGARSLPLACREARGCLWCRSCRVHPPTVDIWCPRLLLINFRQSPTILLLIYPLVLLLSHQTRLVMAEKSGEVL